MTPGDEPDEDLRAAHTRSSGHRDEILRSTRCGCFYCLEAYPPEHIVDWIIEGENDFNAASALCPHCGIDAVLGDAEGLAVEDTAFMRRMHRYWFSAASL